MPAPAATVTIGANDRLFPATSFWPDLSDTRTWANGGYGNLEGDFDDVRYEHLPRPQLYGFPNNEFLAESQDIHGQQFVQVPTPGRDIDLVHRVCIMGDVLDDQTRARVPTLATRFRMPKYGRVQIEASFSHACWSITPYGDFGANAITVDPVGYFSMWYGSAQGRTFTEILGTRRYTRRSCRTGYSRGAFTDEQVEPSWQFANMVAALSTRASSSYVATGDSDLLVFVAFTAPRNTFFATANAGAAQNRSRADVFNASLMVRVWKNILT